MAVLPDEKSNRDSALSSARHRRAPTHRTKDNTATEKTGAVHRPTYLDSTQEYALVSRRDLIELSQFGWLQHGCGAAGVFLASLGVSTAASLFAEHSAELGKYWAGFATSGFSFCCGVVLLGVGYAHFVMRDRRIRALFENSRPQPTADG